MNEATAMLCVFVSFAVLGYYIAYVYVKRQKEKELLAKVTAHNKRMKDIEESDLDDEGKQLAIQHGLWGVVVMTYRHDIRRAKLHEELDLKLLGPSLIHWEKVYCHKNR